MYKPALSNKETRQLQSWDDLVYGDAIKSLYEMQLEPIAQQCFGYHLVKLGALSQSLDFRGCQIKHQLSQNSSFAAGKDEKKPGVIASINHLPYEERSIDAFLLAHVLDFTQDPHQVLREVDFCLIPNGQIIVIGFNPYSVAGVARYLPFKRDNAIHWARFFSRSRVRDWLSLLGYEVTLEKRFLFADFLFGGALFGGGARGDSRFNEDSKTKRQWQQFMQKHLSFFASVYVIVAKKREFPLSLIKPKWKAVPKFSPVGASIRIKATITDK